MFDPVGGVPVERLRGIVPGQDPCGDRADGDFRTLDKDQTVLIVVR
jgi:hypothetical protein